MRSLCSHDYWRCARHYDSYLNCYNLRLCTDRVISYQSSKLFASPFSPSWVGGEGAMTNPQIDLHWA